MDLQGTTIPVVYEKEKELIAEFLRTWTPSDEEGLYIENWTVTLFQLDHYSTLHCTILQTHSDIVRLIYVLMIE